MQEKFYNFVKNALVIIICTLIGSILLSRLFISVDYLPSESHSVYARFYHFFDYISIIIVFLLLFFCKFKISNKVTKIVIVSFPIILGVFSLYLYKYPSGSDSYICWNFAKLFNSGSNPNEVLSAIDNYLQMYPFQYGFISVLRLFESIFGVQESYQIFQIIMVGLSNLALYNLIYEKLDNNKEYYNAVYLMVSIFWIIPWLYSPYAYGFALGLSFAIFSLYFFAKYLTDKKSLMILLSCVFAILAVYIKMNFAILIVAYLLYIIFIMRKEMLKKLVLVLITTLTLILSMNSVSISAKLIDGIYLPNGVPITAWLVMSSPVEQEVVGKNVKYPRPTVGYYSGYNYDVAKENNFDEISMKNAVREDLNYTLNYILKNPLKSLKYYLLKIVDTWDSNDFLSRQYMIGEDTRDVTIIQNYDLTFGFSGFLVKLLTNVGSILILLGSIMYICNIRKSDDTIYLILCIWFIGGFLYHLLFETKAVYVYPYMTILMPIASVGFVSIQEKIQIIKTNKKYNALKYMFIPLVLIVAFVHNTQGIYINSFESYADAGTEVVLYDNMTLKQTLTVDSEIDIDAIEFEYRGRLNDNVLQVSIKDNDKLIQQITIDQNKLYASPKYINVKIDSIKLPAYKELVIEFSVKGNSNSDFSMIYGYTSWDDDSVIIDDKVYENNTINYKLQTKEYSRWYYYQNNKAQYINDMYYN